MNCRTLVGSRPRHDCTTGVSQGLPWRTRQGMAVTDRHAAGHPGGTDHPVARRPPPPRAPRSWPIRPRHGIGWTTEPPSQALASLVLSATGSSEHLDPHPDLIRAANTMGSQPMPPAPGAGWIRWCSFRYVFSDELGPFSGRLRTKPELLEWALEYGFLEVYVVEVCTGCRWNHLRHLHARRREPAARRGGHRPTFWSDHRVSIGAPQPPWDLTRG